MLGRRVGALEDGMALIAPLHRRGPRIIIK
jgi:hypothetical protein